MTYEELLLLKENLVLMADERDPKTGLKVEDTILKSTFNKRMLLDAACIIDKLLKLDFNPEVVDRRKKYSFYLSDEDKKKIPISDTPITISAFAYAINSLIDEKKMKRIKASQITSWLMAQGFLSETEATDGKKFKILTDKSSSVGISSEERRSECGRVYRVNLYDQNGQLFIIDHLNEIAGFDHDLI